MIKKIIGLPLLVLSLSFSQATFANHGMMGKHHQCLTQTLNHLKLTGDQKTKIKAINEQSQKDMTTQWESMGAIHGQVKDMIKADKLDDAKLTDLINQAKEIVGSIIKTKIVAKNQIYNLLDDKQKATFFSSMEQCEKHQLNDMKKEMTH